MRASSPSGCVRQPPTVPLQGLRALWFQLPGTRCNLACRHCFNASGPRDPWLAELPPAVVRRHIAEAEALGVREFYFTGGEPFVHPDLVALLEAALAVGPTTVLTNGTLIDAPTADRLAAIAAGSLYSLEIRISVDGATAEENDAVRGHGSFVRALAAVRLLADRRLYPIVTATAADGAGGLYDRLRACLIEAGVDRPRLKLLPVIPLGRAAGARPARLLSSEDLDGFDTSSLSCASARVVAADGVYACPILAGLPGARLGATLTDGLRDARLFHPACSTCYETGLSCSNT